MKTKLPFPLTRTISIEEECSIKGKDERKTVTQARQVHMPRKLDHFSVIIGVPDGRDVHANMHEATLQHIHRLNIDGPRGLIELVAKKLDAMLDELDQTCIEQWRAMVKQRDTVKKK